MKNLRVTTTILAMAFVGLTAMSCKDGQKEDSSATMDSEVSQEQASTSKSNAQNPESQQVLADYMVLKDALVATDGKAAAEAGKKLESTLKSIKLDSYTSDQQKELKEIVESSTEHAEHIGRSDMAHQREHFQMLTQDVTDMVAITGTENTLYQQFCPMYGEGGAWLSMEKEIRNPYFGSKMMKCGEVQKEIN
ncbi:DUF3347 domain-containing protein [Gelidibacter pelagius]|uniref:DUF3347 domain-containing protein n=1 Tax=Gelidibacter pelagius TaxID=2819985 RepID=A0ABS3SRP6_9FLAO|nr:DUF3347 domain-containing protein [Gelidibacter pelagius]MBO3098384.1 DUF3347 domain-containing protein [Gelidibacter pelagius]